MCRPIAIAAMIIVAFLIGSYGVPGASTSREIASLAPLGLPIPADIAVAAAADAH
jgi:hypothetical protein